MIRRERLFPEKLKPLKSATKSYNDLIAAGSVASQASSIQQTPQQLSPGRSLSTGNSPTKSWHPLPEIYPTGKVDYELISECGQGATAKVWRGRCIPLQEEVAIKIVDLESAGQNLDTIIKEAQLLCGLRHPNVLSLRACFVEEHYLWMILPYISGGSVESAMNYGFPKGLSERVIAPIMLSVLKALVYLHKHSIVHRDVKASNILLDRDNIVLGDFGIAANVDRRLDHCSKEEFGRYLNRNTFVGTPVWMAPEVIEQSCGHGSKADIYSFGMTILELARGKAPFAGMPFEVVAMNKLHHPSPCLPSSYEGREYTHEMQEVVTLCLEKDPAKRPTAAQLLKHPWFKWVRPAKDAVKELLTGVPGPVQRLNSLTRRSKENPVTAEDDFNPFAADERLSFKSLMSKDAQQSMQSFDANDALVMLQRMLNSSGVTPEPLSSSLDSQLVVVTPKSSVSTPTRTTSFTRRRSSFARGSQWPNLPTSGIKHCKGILFASAGRRGFGLQTTWGHGFVMAHIPCPDNGKSCWSGPCYVYISGTMHVGVGENIRESIVLFNDKKVLGKLDNEGVVKMQDIKLVDAVEENLGKSGVCAKLQEEASPSAGVAFRHYSGTKAWKNHGIVHVDTAANEQVYGRPVSPEAIFAGKLRPPSAFTPLIDVLISCEEERYEKNNSFLASDGDSDSSSGGLRYNLSGPLRNSSFNGKGSLIKQNSLPSAVNAAGLDTAFSGSFNSLVVGSPLTPPTSSFADASNMSAVPEEEVVREPSLLESQASCLRASASEPILMMDCAQLARLVTMTESATSLPGSDKEPTDLPDLAQSRMLQGDSELDLPTLSLQGTSGSPEQGTPDEQCLSNYQEPALFQGSGSQGQGFSAFSEAAQFSASPPEEAKNLELEKARSAAASPLARGGKEAAWRPPKPPQR